MTAQGLRDLIEGDELTDQEIVVLYGIASGETTAQTAARVFLATDTVKEYRKKIVAKLGAKNSANAVAIAIGSGIINIDRVVDMDEG